MTEAALVEGQVKLRDGKKWKTRWLVLRKPSPVADCLLMLAYKDKSERAKGLRERSSLTLEDICGLEPGLPYEGLAHTLAIICLSQAVMLGFDSREAMCAWDARIRYALGEVHRFHVTVAPGTKLESGPATLHLCNDVLVVARDIPPAVMGQWKLSDLRRYGAVPNGFIFEGGTRCGYWAGVFFLSSAEGEQISFLFDCIVRGISPTKGPFGLRPVLPDPSPGGPAAAEERVAQEALEALRLEKRLSLLSHAGRLGSGGDDRSLSSSSSEASHSDVSAGGRLTAWPEPSSSSASTSQEGPGLAAAQASAETVPGTSRPPPKPLRPRQLQEVGRQSSSDSGIATGSHSSYSGSFSSCAGSSLDVWRAGDEFGSLLSLPPAAGGCEPSLCACPPGTAEYQVPTALRHHYDTPRSLRQAPGDQTSAVQGSLDDGGAGDSGGQMSAGCPSGCLGARRRGQVAEGPGSEAPVETWEAGSPHAGPPPAFFSTCPACGGLKGAAASPPGLLMTHSGCIRGAAGAVDLQKPLASQLRGRKQPVLGLMRAQDTLSCQSEKPSAGPWLARAVREQAARAPSLAWKLSVQRALPVFPGVNASGLAHPVSSSSLQPPSSRTSLPRSAAGPPPHQGAPPALCPWSTPAACVQTLPGSGAAPGSPTPLHWPEGLPAGSPGARETEQRGAPLPEHPRQPLLQNAAAVPGPGAPGGRRRDPRGRGLPLRTDRHRGHRGSPQGGGPARTDPGAAAARAGAEEEGAPAVRTPQPRHDHDLASVASSRGHQGARPLPRPRRSELRAGGLLAAGWPQPVLTLPRPTGHGGPDPTLLRPQ
uniref:Protein Dok-7 n=2 Tax=Canis lupus familiaris TaxID=9615 RepID=A0A8C0RAR8_CANLF